MNDFFVGLDIGSSRICGAVGRLDKYLRLQILAATSSKCEGVKKGVVIDIDSTAEAITSCIRQLERISDIPINSVYISIPTGICDLVLNRGVISISSDDREINDHDVRRALESAKVISIPSDKEIVGIIPYQYIVDGYDSVKEPVGMSGSRLEVEAQAVIAKTTVVDNLFKCVNKAGVNIDGMVLQAVACAGVVLTKEQLTRGVTVVNAGAEIIDISVFKDKKIIFSDIVPIGGNSITNDISFCFKVPFEEAEKIKLKYSSLIKESSDNSTKIDFETSSVSNRNIALLKDIMTARAEELFGFVKEKLDKNNIDVSDVVVVGGGLATFKGIGEVGTSILNKPVKVGIPQFIGAASPIYAVATGIIKDAVKSVREKTDTLSNEKVKTKEEEKVGAISKIKKFFTDFF